MNHSYYAVIAFCLLIVAQGSAAQDRSFGLGVIIGEATGISAKLWTSPANAFDLGLGFTNGGNRMGKYVGFYGGGSRVHFHMDYLWHGFEAVGNPEQFPLYYGVGGRINSGGGYDPSVAARGVFGILWLPRSMPMDVFLELSPSLQLASATNFAVDVGFGARYFF